ncbi:MAG: hypothetical protein ACJ76S_03965 [Solirubrobacteraceae bacterium]|jgi:hypothetical protein
MPSTVRVVYGQILTTSVVAALSEDRNAGPAEILFSVALSMLVFWLAHVYAQAVALRLGRQAPLTWREVRTIMRQEWPIMQAAVPALVVLGLGWVGVLSDRAAINLAIAVGVVALSGWGFVIGRRSGLSRLGTVGAVVLNGAFGLAIVALKVIVH